MKKYMYIVAMSALVMINGSYASQVRTNYDITHPLYSETKPMPRQSTEKVALPTANQVYGTVRDAAVTGYNKVNDAVTTGYNAVKTKLSTSEAYNKASDVAASGYNSAKDALTQGYEAAKEAVNDAVHKASAWWSNQMIPTPSKPIGNPGIAPAQ